MDEVDVGSDTQGNKLKANTGTLVFMKYTSVVGFRLTARAATISIGLVAIIADLRETLEAIPTIIGDGHTTTDNEMKYPSATGL